MALLIVILANGEQKSGRTPCEQLPRQRALVENGQDALHPKKTQNLPCSTRHSRHEVALSFVMM